MRNAGEATLYIGSEGHLDALKLDERDGRIRIAARADERRLLEFPGYVTALHSIAGGLAATVWRFGAESDLYLIDSVEE
jgi:hypothetical protein